MSRKKLVMIPSVGISLAVLSVAVVVMGGYVPHESIGHGLMVEESAQTIARLADVAVIGTIGDSSTYLVYHNMGELTFPKVHTLTELTVSDVLLGDTGLQGDVITIRTLGERTTVSRLPLAQFQNSVKTTTCWSIFTSRLLSCCVEPTTIHRGFNPHLTLAKMASTINSGVRRP